jgi:hypothetical protein
MSRSEASWPGGSSGEGPPVPSGRHRRPRLDRGLAVVGGLISRNYRLQSDAGREGQDAFRASPFRRLAITQTLSFGGDALVTVALAGSLFFNISVHAARGRVALSLLLTIAPFAVVAPLLGPIIDRARGGRRAMIVVSAAGRATACLLMARYVHGLLLFPAAFLTLVCSKSYTVAKAALVPAVVEHNEDLVEANSKLAVGGGIAGFLAAVPGIPILKLFGAATLLRVDSVVFVLCAVSALRLVPARPAAAAPPAPAGSVQAVAPSRPDGTLAPGALTAAALAMGSLRFLVGFMVFLVTFALRRTHAPAWWYGVILAMSVGGNLVGAVIAPRLRGRVKEEHILAAALAAVVAAGLVAIPIDLLQRRPAAALLAAAVGVASGAAKLAFDSLVQREVPAANQGRVFGRLEATFQLLWVVGALVPVAVTVSLGTGDLVVMAVAAGASVVYLAGLSLARRDRLPTWWPDIGPAHSPPAPTGIAGGVGDEGPPAPGHSGAGSGAPAAPPTG